MKYLKLFYIIILVICLFCKSPRKETKLKIPSKNESAKYEIYSLHIIKKTIFGSNDLSKEEYLIGRAADIAIDSKKNVYICDDINHAVKKFDKNGKFIKNFEFHKGEGPGDFLSPRRLYVNGERLYILDHGLSRITIFDLSGKFQKVIRITTMRLANFVVSGEQAYLVGFGIYNSPPIQVVDLQKGNVVAAFGQRGKDSLLVAKSGNTAHLSLDTAENLYYADYYPYIISKYAPDMKLISVFSRKANFLHSPIRIPSKKIPNSYFVASRGGIRDIAIYDDNLFVLLTKIPKAKKTEDGAKTIQLLDLLNNATGKWLLTMPVDKYFNVSWTRCIRVDKSGNLYFTNDEPFPCVVKLCLEIRDKYGNIIFSTND